MLAELDWIADHGFAGAYVPGVLASGRTCRPSTTRTSIRSGRPARTSGLPIVIHAGYGQRAVRVPGRGRGPPARRWRPRAATTCCPRSSTTPRGSSPRTPAPPGHVAADARRRLRPSPQPAPADDRGARRLAAGDAPAPRRRLRGGAAPSRQSPEGRASTGTSTASRRCRSCTRPRSACATRSGVETISFGRDYPHAEGTWPNTADWLTRRLRRRPRTTSCA